MELFFSQLAVIGVEIAVGVLFLFLAFSGKDFRKFHFLFSLTFVFSGLLRFSSLFLKISARFYSIETILLGVLSVIMISRSLEKHFFAYSLLALPGSLYITYKVTGVFMESIGAVISLIIFSEVLIYLLVNGDYDGRMFSILGLSSSTLLIVLHYPVRVFPPNIHLYLRAMSIMMFYIAIRFYAFNRDGISVTGEANLRYIWYSVLTVLLVTVVGYYIKEFSTAFLLSGILTTAVVSAKSFSKKDMVEEVENFLTVSFATGILVWAGITLLEVSMKGSSVIVDVNYTLSEVSVATALLIIGIKSVWK